MSKVYQGKKLSNTIKIRCHLKDLMEEKRLTQTKVAEDTELSFNTVNKLYRNEFHQIKVDTIVRICAYFEIPIADLFETVEYTANNYQ